MKNERNKWLILLCASIGIIVCAWIILQIGTNNDGNSNTAAGGNTDSQTGQVESLPLVEDDDGQPQGETSAESDVPLSSNLTVSDSLADPVSSEDDTVIVTFLDVGQGSCTIVEHGNSCIIADGGPSEAGEALVNYLSGRGIKRVSLMIASHYDEDHIAGLIDVLNCGLFKVGNVWQADYKPNDTKVFKNYDEALTKVRKVDKPDIGYRYRASLDGAAVRVSLLAGNDRIKYEDANSYSLVCQFDVNNVKILCPGDATLETEKNELSGKADVDSDIIAMPHHGSGTAASKKYLEAVTPDLAIVSCGKNNSYGHPNEKIVKRLSSMNIPMLRTDENGTIQLAIDKKGEYRIYRER